MIEFWNVALIITLVILGAVLAIPVIAVVLFIWSKAVGMGLARGRQASRKRREDGGPAPGGRTPDGRAPDGCDRSSGWRSKTNYHKPGRPSDYGPAEKREEDENGD